MARNTHRRPLLATVVVASVLVVSAGCDDDTLVPDVTTDDPDTRTPATDTRTVDPPTVSNLPITQP